MLTKTSNVKVQVNQATIVLSHVYLQLAKFCVKKEHIREFKDLLPNSSLHDKFYEFLKEQFAEENLEFYHLITNFEKSQKTGKELSEEANHILCKYLGFGDTGMKGMIISISPSIYQELKKVFEEKNYSIRMFSKIRIEVAQLLETLFVEFKLQDKTKEKRKPFV